eukprot:comp16782_c0_seq1/m.15156 comp16782_c0_seq1/g.15156  ORF comp16782_c0_seq1/g.15156 comp16782_c0_seq1/m.15156 type:complete len:152 (-) comp16782_c0_seq1:308-763(-)
MAVLRPVLLLVVLLCVLGAQARTRKNFKGEATDHSNYGRKTRSERIKLIRENRQRLQLEESQLPPEQPKGQDSDFTTDFYYFKLYDSNQDGYLDGLELAGLMAKENGDGEGLDDNTIMMMVEHILLEDDHNDDGYIDYPEFIKSEQQHQNP